MLYNRIILKMIKFIIVISLSLVVFTSVQAAPTYEDKGPSVSDWIGSGSAPSFGLIDASRLSVSHNVSFGSSFSGDQSLMSSLYAANFTYRLSDPLTLNFVLGMQNMQFNNVPGLNNQSAFIGGFSMEYRPSRNFLFRIEMQQGPSGLWPSYGVSPYDYNYMYGDRYMRSSQSRMATGERYEMLGDADSH